MFGVVNRIKNFADENGDIYRDTESRYFAYHHDVTWSIQVRGVPLFLRTSRVSTFVSTHLLS